MKTLMLAKCFNVLLLYSMNFLDNFCGVFKTKKMAKVFSSVNSTNFTI
jgi:hypothetical protein